MKGIGRRDGALGAVKSSGGVERNQIDVGVDAFEEGGETLCRFHGIVLPGDEGPFKEDSFPGRFPIGPAGVE